MNILEQFEQEACENGIKVHDYYLGEDNLKGIYMDGHIALNTSVNTMIERACVLAEELGHYHTSYGNILDQKNVENCKQEHKARVWAYNKSVGLIGLVRAFEQGCQSRYEIAEYLDVTCSYLDDAVLYYRNKYGIYTCVDNYIIYFTPCLSVVRLCG